MSLRKAGIIAEPLIVWPHTYREPLRAPSTQRVPDAGTFGSTAILYGIVRLSKHVSGTRLDLRVDNYRGDMIR